MKFTFPKYAAWWDVGWNRFIDSKTNEWDSFSERKRKYIVDRMATAMINKMVMNG